MSYLTVDVSNTLLFSESSAFTCLQPKINEIHTLLHSEIKSKHNLLGWFTQPSRYDPVEIDAIKRTARWVQENSDILLVIGVGGSYIGARAGIEMLTHSFTNLLSKEKRQSPQIIFVGNNFSSKYISDLIELLHSKDFSINVVSKSGKTLESAVAFRVFRELLEEKYGEHEANSRIIITTGEEDSLIHEIAERKGYRIFSIPHTIGGRYSVLTTVGLFPMAVSGIDIEAVLRGASDAKDELSHKEIENNSAYKYASTRNSLYRRNKSIEILVSYEPCFQSFTEWWKQLFAESEGKNEKGIFPSSAVFSTDLHSVGQYIQEGRRDLFETIIKVAKVDREIKIEQTAHDWDELNYLAGHTVEFINEQVFKGTLQAHTEAGIPNIVLNIPEITPYSFGYLVFFFQLSCAVSSYLLGVNPFDQPGVEAYKEKVNELLGQLT